jgi:hypothetical protein
MNAETDAVLEIATLRHPRTIRERAERIYALCAAGELNHFALDESKLPSVVERVIATTRAAYPDVRNIPYHSRFRHFDVGGVPRVYELTKRIAAESREERLRTLGDLIMVSVLVDAGAGEHWAYREPGTNLVFSRSEGLAVASLHWFTSGGLARNPKRKPLAVDAEILRELSVSRIAEAFQATPDNPMVGLDGRADVLRRLGEVIDGNTHYFGATDKRPGNLLWTLSELAVREPLTASHVLAAVLDALGPIWPGRESIAGINLGDVWLHPRVGRVPFHKLSQWLTYSLCEALEHTGHHIGGIEALTGLAEYRNGGLFVDAGVLRPKHPEVLEQTHSVGSEIVVEWRALTVALLDRTAAGMRRELGLDERTLPLAKVLEGGTWSAGRQIARELRADGCPPIRVESDGTVF